MSSNIRIERICEWCGNRFMAQTTVTRFCSKRCSEHAYKERLRQKKVTLSNQETAQTNFKWRDKDYLTPTQAAKLLGIGRMSIYRYIRNGKIKVVRFERKTLISKADIQAMFDFLSPKESEPKEGAIENVNKLVRQYIPKKSNFNSFSDKYIMDVAKKLNLRPRKKLGFSNPKTEFFKQIDNFALAS